MSNTLFSQLVGQNTVAKKLLQITQDMRQVTDSNRNELTHSWIFVGPMGSGRSIAALYFACALQCEAAVPACGECKQCRMVLTNTHPDVYKYLPTGLSISVAEIREMINFSAKQPTVGTWQIILIEDADRLTESAGNALLKSLEEPGTNTIFLLCAPSTTPEDIPITITSRCQSITLNLPASDKVAEYLASQDIEATMAEWAAKVSGGHIGRAKRLATDEKARTLRTLGIELFLQIVKAYNFTPVVKLLNFVKEVSATTKAIDKTEKVRLQRDLLDLALQDILSFLRDAMFLSLGVTAEINNSDLEIQLAWLGKNFSAVQIVKCFEAVQDTRELLAKAVKPDFALAALLGNFNKILH